MWLSLSFEPQRKSIQYSTNHELGITNDAVPVRVRHVEHLLDLRLAHLVVQIKHQLAWVPKYKKKFDRNLMVDNTGTGRFFMMWVNSDFERLFFSFFHFFARSYGCLEKKTCTSDEHNYYCNVTTTLVHGLCLLQFFGSDQFQLHSCLIQT